MRTRFMQGLDELRHKLLKMGGMVEQAIDRACESYRLRDPKLAQTVLNGEDAVNEMEREIDELALDLLAMQQPMAVDLRFIVACVKINSDLERVGDQAVNVAERVLDLNSMPPVEIAIDIPRMAQAAAGMVRSALESFIREEADLARTVLERDEHLDGMNRENFGVALQKISTEPDKVRQAMDILIISRNLERVGDHATNIAEDVIFWVSGADVRHMGPGKVNDKVVS
jgi:phosphate transport system protein